MQTSASARLPGSATKRVPHSGALFAHEWAIREANRTPSPKLDYRGTVLSQLHRDSDTNSELVNCSDTRYIRRGMIQTFKHAGLERFYRTGSKSGIQPAHAAKLAKQLFALNNATAPSDMAVFPSWRWHALKGQHAGHYALWVNANWRLTFAFEGKDAVLVDYQDYH